MSKFDNLEWKTVEVDADIVTDEAGFLGLEVLDGSKITVEKSESGWTLKPKESIASADIQTTGDSSSNLSIAQKEIGKDNGETNKKQRKKKKKKNKGKRKLADAVDANTMDFTAPSESLVPKSGYVDQHVIYYNQQNDWSRMGLNLNICKSLLRKQFKTPTDIQKACLQKAIRDRRDILAAAKTGSGKTLAFGLPIIQLIMEKKLIAKEKAKKSRSNPTPASTKARHLAGSSRDGVNAVSALILTPTRELAMQIHKHLSAIITDMDSAYQEHTEKEQAGNEEEEYDVNADLSITYAPVTITTVVGGIAEQKQIRLLSKQPDIVVATPGRLWTLISQGNEHLKNLHLVQFFVLDEADRMVQKGHYQELDNIIQRVINPVNTRETFDENDDDVDDMKALEQRRKQLLRLTKRQTFLFSATLSIGSVGRQATTKRTMHMKFKKKRRRLANVNDSQSELEKLMERVGLRGKPFIVDLTVTKRDKEEKNGVKDKMKSGDGKNVESKNSTTVRKNQISLPKKLELRRIECVIEDKDVYIYHFCAKYTGRILIFANTINVVRRIHEMLKLLRINVYAIHAQMQQRQRMKNLDRFRQSKNIVLVATDVASRGIDIPNVDYVMHYNVPRNVEIFIHRSGRTARANKDGVSVLMISPLVHEVQSFKRISHVLNIDKDRDMPELEAEMAVIRRAKTRVKLSRQILASDSAQKQAKAKEDWFLKQAEAMDMVVDEDLLVRTRSKGSRNQGEEKTYRHLKMQLNDLLNRELF